MHMENSIGVRKGAWTHEEDKLLRACIHKYGEGKWHLVPERAGLNRCRKSCRLRWLNYLSPNIKRGSFSEDEVDLILRLHKLLKNRWSLIAGRLPGRTANDVKNYWHTRLAKKVASDSDKKEKLEKQKETAMKAVHHHHEVIRPQPRAFSVNHHSSLLEGKHVFANDGDVRVVCATPKEASRNCDVGDVDCAAQPFDEHVGHEQYSTWSLLIDQDVNSISEFPEMEDFYAGVPPSGSDSCWDDFEYSIWNLQY